MLKLLKQRQKGFLSNLTKTINRAEVSIENETNISEIALWRENAEFSIFKLQKNLEDICLHQSGTEITKAQQLFNENNERENRVLIRWESLVRQFDDDKQTEIATYAFDQLCKSRSSKGSKYSGSSSRTSNDWLWPLRKAKVISNSKWKQDCTQPWIVKNEAKTRRTWD